MENNNQEVVALYTHNLQAYLYWQWEGDEYIKAFFDSYNKLANQQVDDFNSLNLPNYFTKTGLWLDYVAKNIYGMDRKQVLYANNLIRSGLNTVDPNDIDPNAAKVIKISKAHTMTDEEFKKIIQWNFYKADGFIFTIPYLKRRIIRFLNICPNNEIDINDVSITSKDRIFYIKVLNNLANSPFMQLLQDAIINKLINLPFMYDLVLEIE
ncbi:unnamed protein product [Commensalibacter communis]|uniref:Uncharacterized protein n=1 Tax=Commensalibacter communis TaxID=2972786 RepID=A0A9W4TTA3_9PROT|nr:hypothetical protein [Commensalibacter communis]CAI3954530.1 unnamed protein product [Commensalibacter communis]CAI3958312.1 unnamed protein product [Commensalibacter communis]CAI3958363.1 unnamed protein product [Commensalibacter communis]CAI3959853.1 unnamed protein product [Commensalibacter communis]